MRRSVPWLVVPLVLLAGLAGWWIRGRTVASATPEREVLYWVDPMNPGFRSPEAGVAPCGMPLEPVYADGAAGDSPTPDPVAEAIRVPGARRQLVGIVVEIVEREAVEGRLRLPGRVAADERRAHVIAPKAVARVGALGVATEGSLVREGEFLVSLTGDSASITQWTLLEGLRDLDEVRRKDPDNTEEILRLEAAIRASEQTLLAYGMSREMIGEIKRKRQPSSNIEVHSPISGYVVSRSAVLGEEYHAFATLFVVADIRSVFVLVDVFNEDIELVRPGTKASIRVPGRPQVFETVVGRVPPQFDSTFNGVKIRIEVDNQGQVLLPGMFVDVEMPIRMPETISVPAGAVIDSGLRKRVYIDLGEGRFTPREVRTGWRLGDRVQILEGLAPGEAVVVSGNFLLDSESRMRASGEQPVAPVDPVCGMHVDVVGARNAALVSENAGASYYFCNPACKERFDEDPQAFLAEASAD
jgi:RND family efflux transporter MFP subunit